MVIQLLSFKVSDVSWPGLEPATLFYQQQYHKVVPLIEMKTYMYNKMTELTELRFYGPVNPLGSC